MALSRQILELWQAISDEHGAAVFFDAEAQTILESYGEYRNLCRRLGRRIEQPETAAMLALRSLSVMRQALEEKLAESELVVTFPGGSYSVARPTYTVIREMLRGAQREIVLAGYRITNKDILSLLHRAALRGVTITLICGRKDGDGYRVLESWPSDCKPPLLYEDIEREDENALMHIKALLVDESELLVTSANFTFFAMEKNFELGIRTTGKAAREARKVMNDLIESESFTRLD